MKRTMMRRLVRGDLLLWDGLPLLRRSPMAYVLLVLVAPATVAAALAVVLASWWAGIAAFAGALVAMWLIQFFYFQ